jgi:hypothetical protein
MVADDGRNFAIKLSRTVTLEDVEKAVARLADEQGHPWLTVGEVELPVHLVSAPDQRLKVIVDLLLWNHKIRQVPFNAHEKMLQITVNVLVQIDDVATILVDKLSDQGHQAWSVRTMYEQDGTIIQGRKRLAGQDSYFLALLPAPSLGSDPPAADR